MATINYFHILVGIAFIYLATIVQSNSTEVTTTLKVLGGVLIIVHAYLAYAKSCKVCSAGK